MAQHRRSEAIQQAMAATRLALVNDVQITQARARQLVDWRYQFRMHPAALCAAAAVLGFLIVPGRRKPVGIAASTASHPTSQLDDEPNSQGSAASSLASDIGRTIALALAKHAVRTISDQGLSAFRRAASSRATDERQPQEPQDVVRDEENVDE